MSEEQNNRKANPQKSQSQSNQPQKDPIVLPPPRETKPFSKGLKPKKQ